MTRRGLLMMVVGVLVLVTLAQCRAFKESQDIDAYDMLEQLERYYSQAARPRIDRRGFSDEARIDPELLHNALQLLQLQTIDRYNHKARPRIDRRGIALDSRIDPEILDSALRLLQLQTIDRHYTLQRPRFGKRAESATNWAKDLDKQSETPNWLSYARRR